MQLPNPEPSLSLPTTTTRSPNLTNPNPNPSTPSPPRQFYFAYGSNLSPTQMAQRCPSSSPPLAIAKLSSHTWFICSRGYANVLPVPPRPASHENDASVVYGLLFRLTPEDEETLDGFEGWDVRKCGGVNPVVGERGRKPFLQGGCAYNKFYLKVKVERWLVPEGERGVEGIGLGMEMGGKAVTSLVYVDEVRITPGRIKDEYIGRLSRAALESVPLGMPEGWFDANMKRYGVVWWKGGTVEYDEEYGKLYMSAPPREEWEDVRMKYMLEEAQGLGGTL